MTFLTFLKRAALAAIRNNTVLYWLLALFAMFATSCLSCGRRRRYRWLALVPGFQAALRRDQMVRSKRTRWQCNRIRNESAIYV
jgi:hypothetical protein